MVRAYSKERSCFGLMSTHAHAGSLGAKLRGVPLALCNVGAKAVRNVGTKGAASTHLAMCCTFAVVWQVCRDVWPCLV